MDCCIHRSIIRIEFWVEFLLMLVLIRKIYFSFFKPINHIINLTLQIINLRSKCSLLLLIVFFLLLKNPNQVWGSFEHSLQTFLLLFTVQIVLLVKFSDFIKDFFCFHQCSILSLSVNHGKSVYRVFCTFMIWTAIHFHHYWSTFFFIATLFYQSL